MKILFLDDDRNRHYEIRACFGSSVTHVETVGRALEWLEKETWDVVSLDHDLAGRVSGSDLTRMLTVTPSLAKNVKFWMIHSANPIGARHMADDLNRIVPGKFVSLTFGRTYINYLKHHLDNQ